MNALKIGIAVLLTMVVAAGCGYRLAGGGYLNEDVTRVSVHVFGNRSSESGAGIRFTNELIREIAFKTDTRVSDEATRMIVGVIKSITFSDLSRTSSTDVVERKVTVKLDVKLVNVQNEILWSVKDFSASEDYTVSSNSVDDEAGKREAVDAVFRRVAERLVSRMTSDF